MNYQLHTQVHRRIVRLFSAIHELHQQGYQNLAFRLTLKNNELAIQLAPFDELYYQSPPKNKDFNIDYDPCYEYESDKSYHFLRDTPFRYFSWDDAINLNRWQLAELIKKRLPKLIEHCKYYQPEYVGWFSYFLGQVKNNNFPKFNGHTILTEENQNNSTSNHIHPPFQILQHSDRIQWLWQNNIDISDDWHTAYRPYIKAIPVQQIRRYPTYPIVTNDLFEMGAYWEGAVYYLHHILGYRDERSYLCDKYLNNEDFTEFNTIFDTTGDVELLDAFFARLIIKKEDGDIKVLCKKIMDDVEYKYSSEKPNYHNPYFGGQGPLHTSSLKYLA